MDVNVEIDELVVDEGDDSGLLDTLSGQLDPATAVAVAHAVSEAVLGDAASSTHG